jgi:hypothetical protein
MAEEGCPKARADVTVTMRKPHEDSLNSIVISIKTNMKQACARVFKILRFFSPQHKREKTLDLLSLHTI